MRLFEMASSTARRARRRKSRSPPTTPGNHNSVCLLLCSDGRIALAVFCVEGGSFVTACRDPDSACALVKTGFTGRVLDGARSAAFATTKRTNRNGSEMSDTIGLTTKVTVLEFASRLCVRCKATAKKRKKQNPITTFALRSFFLRARKVSDPDSK